MSVSVQQLIEQLGYTPKEARVYLAALSLGEAHISDIAAKAKLPRTSTQLIVDQLHTDGLMNFYVMRRYKYWVAENPERLLANAERRATAARDALPSLKALHQSARKTASVGSARGAFNLLADASPQPILVTNAAGEIVHVNGAWETEFGYTRTEVLGLSPRVLQSGKTPPETYERMWRTLTEGRLFQSDEIIDKRKDGTIFNVLTTVFPVEHSGELFYIQILDDITERKRVEALVNQFSTKRETQSP